MTCRCWGRFASCCRRGADPHDGLWNGGDNQDAQALGATVLNKPFELDELRRLVSEPGTEAK